MVPKNKLFIILFTLFLISCESNKDLKSDDNVANDNIVISDSISNNNISIIGVGDIMLGTNFPSVNHLPPDGLNLLDHISDLTKSADITFGNLEGAVLDSGGIPKRCSDPKICYAFRQPEYLIPQLKNAGFDFLSIANNHIFDFGLVGVENTVKTLNNYTFVFAGIESRPWDTLTVKGLKIGFAAFAPNPGTMLITDYKKAEEIIRLLDSISDIVIISFHGGAEGAKHTAVTKVEEEFYNENRGNVYLFAHKVIDYGADVVFGHGPHVTRAIELYKGRFIAYSLGNFCTYDRFNLSGLSGISPLVKLNISQNGELIDGEIHSIIQKGRGIPQLDENQKALFEIIRLTKQDFPDHKIIFKDNKFFPLK